MLKNDLKKYLTQGLKMALKTGLKIGKYMLQNN